MLPWRGTPPPQTRGRRSRSREAPGRPGLDRALARCLRMSQACTGGARRGQRSPLQPATLSGVPASSHCSSSPPSVVCPHPSPFQSAMLQKNPLRKIPLETVVKKGWVIIGWGFPGGSEGKESACSAGDLGSIPGLGRSPAHFSILAWRTSWTEEPGGLKPMGSQRTRHD